MFDESRKYGGDTFDVGGNLQAEASRIAELLVRKLAEDRAAIGQQSAAGDG
jgi:hypothetical protein